MKAQHSQKEKNHLKQKKNLLQLFLFIAKK